MRVSTLVGLFSAVALSFCSTPAQAWWDHGHMLVGAIARQELGPENTERLEAVLRQLDAHYPAFNRLDTAATWADHIHCLPDPKGNPPLPYCEGMERMEGLGALFYENHFVTHIYNPHNVTLKKEYETLPHSTGNAPWMIQTAMKGLTLKGAGTVFSWNLFLRLLLHMVGDQHQPLHTQSSVSKWFDGLDDMGGNRVWIKTSVPNADNLHKLWDSAAGRFPKNWPSQVDLEELQKQARDLIALHPRASYGDRVNELGAWAIAKESQQLASTVVYKEIVASMNTPRNFKEDPYRPSEAYLQEVAELCESQIVLGGYRLADMLKQTLQFLPPMPAQKGDGKDKKMQAVLVTDAQEATEKKQQETEVETDANSTHTHTHHQTLLSIMGLILAVSILSNVMLTSKLSKANQQLRTITASEGNGVSSTQQQQQQGASGVQITERLMQGQDVI
eukprot:GDKI01004372.1.p1 GENE.GDKI01004372.1~~GDKI01004372.1.p1  ORF type:complete len:447 (-),score=168.13 GDKI01004372.1:272-1612(-)